MKIGGRDCLLFLREKGRIRLENGILMLGDFCGGKCGKIGTDMKIGR